MKKLSHLNSLSVWVGLVLILGTSRMLGAAAMNAERIGRDNPFDQILTDIQTTAPAPQAPPVVEERPELALEAVVLKFLNPNSLEPVLEAMVYPYGSVSVDEANNTVIICDTPEKLEKILAHVEKADQARHQVVIEVLILDVQLHDDAEIGVNWDLLTDDRSNVIYRQNLSGSRLRSTIEDAVTIGDATAFNTIGLGGDFSVISGTVRHVLHTIQQKRNVEILASPRALVVSGRSAMIQAVEEIPYQEVSDTSAGGQGALTSTKFKEVGITLQVTAIVADSNNIFLTVDTEQNVRTGQSSDGVPVVDTRRANTAVSLKDGQTVVIGGLRREEVTKEVSQVPLLGDLPILGGLFRSTSKVRHNSELVVILSPHIENSEPLPPAVAARYDAVREGSLLSRVLDEASDGDEKP